MARAGPRTIRLVVLVVFTITGFSALTLQVVWQRIISLHGGVDLFSTTTVVAAFLGGLGVGSLVGGVLADRLGARGSLVAFASANCAIAGFATGSVWLFYDLYRGAVPVVGGSLVTSFAFNVVLLAVPTTLMGLSLPLVARGIVVAVDEIGPLVGRLYAVNTLGAAAGAAVSGWVLVGTLGFTGTVRIAALLNLVAVLLILTLWEASGREVVVPEPVAAYPVASTRPARAAVAPWLLVYGFTGAIALGLEIVFFRMLGAVMRSNAYAFGHVLCLYLLAFGLGTALGSRWVRRSERPERSFLWLQFGAGLAAVGGTLLVLAPLELPSFLGIRPFLEDYFAGNGFVNGGYSLATARSTWQLLFANLLAPLIIMGIPVALIGASFPFIQAVVARRVDTLGRRTGALLFANVVGNVGGALLAGFVLIDLLGTSGTLRLLAALLLLPGLAAAASGSARWRTPAALLALVATLAGTAAFPSNRDLWAKLHSAAPSEFVLAEERSCVTALVPRLGLQLLYINATTQNGFPYDDFHVLIGLAPTVLHPDPQRAMAVGLGAGGTTYGMAVDPRLDEVKTVEICGGEIDLIEHLGANGSVESASLLADPRVDFDVGDGRKFLLGTDDKFDIVTADTLRPQSGYSGSLYSVEFYELVNRRLDDDGLFVQWAPTTRSLASVREVFPHVMLFEVPTYNCSQFLVASRSPVVFDRPAVISRFLATDPERAFGSGLAASLSTFFNTVEPTVLPPPARVGEDELNRDLFPRDEYFLNNELETTARASCPTPAPLA